MNSWLILCTGKYSCAVSGRDGSESLTNKLFISKTLFTPNSIHASTLLLQIVHFLVRHTNARTLIVVRVTLSAMHALGLLWIVA